MAKTGRRVRRAAAALALGGRAGAAGGRLRGVPHAPGLRAGGPRRPLPGELVVGAAGLRREAELVVPAAPVGLQAQILADGRDAVAERAEEELVVDLALHEALLDDRAEIVGGLGVGHPLLDG